MCMGFLFNKKGSIISDYFLLVCDESRQLKANNACEVALYKDYLEIGKKRLNYEDIIKVTYELDIFTIKYRFNSLTYSYIFKDTRHYKGKKLSEKLKELYVAVPKVEPVIQAEPVTLAFKVAGVTFKNGRKTRQAILRAYKWGDEDIEKVDFEQYEYEGEPAVYVKINDNVVGNVPSKLVDKFLMYENKYTRGKVSCDIYGGSKLDDGTRTSYGCEVTIKYKKELT